MPKSLKVIIKKLAHDGQITEEEYKELIRKIDGHDAELFPKAYNLGYEEGYAKGHADGFAKCLDLNVFECVGGEV